MVTRPMDEFVEDELTLRGGTCRKRHCITLCLMVKILKYSNWCYHTHFLKIIKYFDKFYQLLLVGTIYLFIYIYYYYYFII
jgi:hypothetical protein